MTKYYSHSPRHIKDIIYKSKQKHEADGCQCCIVLDKPLHEGNSQNINLNSAEYAQNLYTWTCNCSLHDLSLVLSKRQAQLNKLLKNQLQNTNRIKGKLMPQKGEPK